MGELWRDLVELLRQRPMLWLPVLVADLLGYLVNLGRNLLLQAIVLHQTAQHSVLGGAVVHQQLSAGAMQGLTVVALLLSWLAYLLRILLYSAALVATAAMVRAVLLREPKPTAEVGPALTQKRGGILELALRALAVYAVAALLLGWFSPVLIKHNFAKLLHDPWFGYGMTLLVLLVLAVSLAPVALRVLAGCPPVKAIAQLSQQFACVLAVVTSVLAAVVSANSRMMAGVTPAARYPLEIVGSLMVALPYVLLFTGLAVLARRVERQVSAAAELG